MIWKLLNFEGMRIFICKQFDLNRLDRDLVLSEAVSTESDFLRNWEGGGLKIPFNLLDVNKSESCSAEYALVSTFQNMSFR